MHQLINIKLILFWDGMESTIGEGIIIRGGCVLVEGRRGVFNYGGVGNWLLSITIFKTDCLTDQFSDWKEGWWVGTHLK